MSDQLTSSEDVQLTPEESAKPALNVDPNLIGAIVAAVMQQLGGSKAQPAFNMQELGEVIGQSVAAGIAKTTRRKVSFGEYVQGATSSYHSGLAKNERPQLRRPAFDNGVFMSPSNLFVEEIELLNRISHSGRYFDRKMEVIVSHDGSEEVIQFRHSNATADQRFDMAQYYGFRKGKHVSALHAMLEQIVEEQEREDAEAQETKEINAELRAMAKERRGGGASGGIGRSKAYREAKARADARDAEV